MKHANKTNFHDIDVKITASAQLCRLEVSSALAICPMVVGWFVEQLIQKGARKGANVHENTSRLRPLLRQFFILSNRQYAPNFHGSRSLCLFFTAAYWKIYWIYRLDIMHKAALFYSILRLKLSVIGTWKLKLLSILSEQLEGRRANWGSLQVNLMFESIFFSFPFIHRRPFIRLLVYATRPLQVFKFCFCQTDDRDRMNDIRTNMYHGSNKQANHVCLHVG